MMKKHAILLVGLLACLIPLSSLADQLGDPAPPLKVTEWIKGTPFSVKDGKHIYVVQLCTLSRANDFGLTNLSALQQKYRDKGVVALAVSDEPAEQLKEFVKVNGAKIDYTVAADNIRKTTLSYLRAYDQQVLPRAYVIGKDGTVLWHGHPMGGLDAILDEITSGRYSLEKTRTALTTREQMEQYLTLARQDAVKGEVLGRQLLAVRTNDATALCDLAFQIATNPYLEKRDVALANAALDRAENLGPTNASHVAVARAILLFQTGKEAEGIAKAREAIAAAKDPEAKAEAQGCLHTMEVRQAMDRTNQNGATPKPR